MKLKVAFQEIDRTLETIVQEEERTFNTDMGDIMVLHDGQNGATFFPTVSNDGVISWTNDRDLDNPPPVNIKGEKGDKGDKGDQGERGLQGVQGIQGEKGEKGDTGAQGIQGVQGVKGDKGDTGAKGATGDKGDAGKDGTSCTHRWSGTTLYITSASGTSSANLKGDKGETGAPGADGKDGTNGKDGYTPIKGKDYFTSADKTEMVNAVISALPKYNGEVATV